MRLPVTNHIVRQYLAHHNNRPSNSISFITAIVSTSGLLHCEFVLLLILQSHRETDLFLASAEDKLAQTNFHTHREAFSSHFKSKVGNIHTKVSALRIVLNIDDTPIASTSHTHPSHSQTSHLLTSSLSLGVSVPRTTQCIRGV
jgi:hypothetical protein